MFKKFKNSVLKKNVFVYVFFYKYVFFRKPKKIFFREKIFFSSVSGDFGTFIKKNCLKKNWPSRVTPGCLAAGGWDRYIDSFCDTKLLIKPTFDRGRKFLKVLFRISFLWSIRWKHKKRNFRGKKFFWCLKKNVNLKKTYTIYVF